MGDDRHDGAGVASSRAARPPGSRGGGGESSSPRDGGRRRGAKRAWSTPAIRIMAIERTESGTNSVTYLEGGGGRYLSVAAS